jgi:hypothetical protein
MPDLIVDRVGGNTNDISRAWRLGTDDQRDCIERDKKKGEDGNEEKRLYGVAYAHRPCQDWK